MKNFDSIYNQYGILPIPEDAQPTMAYVPFQITGETYSPEQGIINGTMFPILDKPFKGSEV